MSSKKGIKNPVQINPAIEKDEISSRVTTFIRCLLA